MKKSVLVLGGSHSELPLIQAARHLGLAVYTSGNRPDHPGHSISDHYFPGDFSDADQMIDVARQSRCNFVVSAANDYAYLSACRVAEKLNFPGFDPVETAEILHHKNCFKPLAVSLGMPVTRFVTLSPEDTDLPNGAALRYPLVVKPVDLTGGKGISVIDTPDQLSKAVSHARQLSKKGVLVVEEYFPGTLHSYSTIIKDGKVVFDYADNEYCDHTPYLVSTSTSVAAVPKHILTDLRFQTEKLAQKTKLIDGILHCQFMYSSGDYVILEYTRRCSGDLYSEVVEGVTGIRHAEQFIRCSIKLEIDLFRSDSKSDYIARHCVFPDFSGYFDGIEITTNLKPLVLSVTEAVPRGHFFDGDKVEKAAVVILRFRRYSDMLRIKSELNTDIRCRFRQSTDTDKYHPKS